MSNYKPRPDLADLSSIDYLRLLTTRELMAMLQNTRAYGDYSVVAQGKQNKYYSFEVRVEDLKKVLGERPHLPTKEERRKTINKSKGIKR